MAIRRLVLVTLLAVVSVALLAQEAAQEQTYVITLKPTVESATAFAAEMTRLYGATVDGEIDPGAGALFVRLTPPRARVLAADPRVATVQAAADLQQGMSAAEVVSWSSGVSYTYDSSGNVWKAGADVFRYDHANRLIYANVNGTPRHYSYDAFGNRTGCQQSPGTQMAANCQLGKTIDATENRNRIEEASYDNAGNVTALDGHEYSYDALNMMTRDKYGSLAREFVYTPDDERIAVYSVGSSWEWTLRDEKGMPLREFRSTNGPSGVGTASWTWEKDYVWRDALLLASRQPETDGITTYHYHLDHLGTPRRITDQKDRILGTHDYFAFGPDVSGGTNEPSYTPLKYTGHERDSWGGMFGTLDYMHARYYHPELGRFFSVDPQLGKVTEPQSWNRYAYVMNNPMRYVDPTGADCENPTKEDPCTPGELDQLAVEQGEPVALHPDDPMIFAYDVRAKTEAAVQVTLGAISDLAEFADFSMTTTFLRQYLDDPTADKGILLASFRLMLIEKTGLNPATAEAHHIFPRKFRDAFERLGIKWNDPEYGAWWTAAEHRARAYEYNLAWEQFLRTNPTKKETLKFGWQMAKKYGLKALFKIK